MNFRRQCFTNTRILCVAFEAAILIGSASVVTAQVGGTQQGAAGTDHVTPIDRPLKKYPKITIPPHTYPVLSHSIGPVDRSGTHNLVRAIEDPHVGPEAYAPGITSNSFPGINYTGSIPSDANGAVGPSNLIEATNPIWNIYDFKGNVLYSTDFNTYFGNSDFYYDPHVIYDTSGGRFVMVVGHTNTSTSGAWWTVMVSHDSDATHGFYYYDFNARLDGGTDQNQWPDFPYVGYDSQALYISSTMFNFPIGAGGSRYVKVRILNKSQIYSASTAGWWDFWDLQSAGSEDWFVAPAEEYTDPGQGLWVNAKYYGANFVTLRRVTNPLDWTNGPQIIVETPSTQAFSPPPLARQPSGAENIDNQDCRILNAAYYNGALDLSQETAYDWGDGNGARSVIHWLRLNNHNVPATVDRDFVWGAAGYDYFYPSVAVNSVHDTTLVFARSGVTEYAGIRTTGWRDSTGETGPEGSAQVKSGENTYVINDQFGRNRWGDFYKACLDPFDFTTVWTVGQYANSGGTWSTWIAETNWKPFTNVVVTNVSGQIGQTVTLAASLTRTDTGVPLAGEALNFLVNGSPAGSATTDVSGNAYLSYTITEALGTGSFLIEVDYTRTSNYNGTAGYGTLTIKAADTNLAVASAAGTPGQTVSLSATLTRNTDGAALVGRAVSFKVGATTVGSATTNASGLVTLHYKIAVASGAYTITGTFSGDSLYNASSGTNQLTVSKTNTALSVASVSGMPGTTVTLKATLIRTSDNAGIGSASVSFYIGSTLVGSGTTSASGVATRGYSIPSSSILGNQTITAKFAGNSSYNAATAAGTLSVKAATTITVTNVSGKRGATVTLTASLKRTNGTAISGAALTFSIGTTVVGTGTTNASGIATRSYSIPISSTTGLKTIKVTYAGSTFYLSSTGTGTLTVK